MTAKKKKIQKKTILKKPNNRKHPHPLTTLKMYRFIFGSINKKKFPIFATNQISSNMFSGFRKDGESQRWKETVYQES